MKFVAILLATILSIGTLTGCSKEEAIESIGFFSATELGTGGAIAVINDITVNESLYRAYLWSAQTFFEMQLGIDLVAMGDIEIEGQTMSDLAKERALESAILAIVTRETAQAQEISLTNDEIDRIQMEAASFMEVNEPIANQHKFTEEDIVNLLVGAEISTKVQLAISETYEPSEEDILAEITAVRPYYEQVTARHILIGTTDEMGIPLSDELKEEKLALANELLDRIKNGEDIGELAAQYSEDPGSKDNNGEYTFERGKMVVEFENAAFDSAEGEIWPEPVETSYGYHIGQTIAHTPINEDEIRAGAVLGLKYAFAEQELLSLIGQADIQKQPLFDEIKIIANVLPNENDTAQVQIEE
ncbi:MAG: hypothetical protein BEN19_04780 [Epulopiscium sp. Nuni2H_MBin003]|nr:MAG: hypothetical protein BEN19_04780 [Epulopiscium sp. Nuni2H_MBin003]